MASKSPEEAIALGIEETFEKLREHAKAAGRLAASMPEAGRPFRTPDVWWDGEGESAAGDEYRSWLNDLLPDSHRSAELPNGSRRELLKKLAVDFRSIGTEAGNAYAIIFETAGQEFVTLADVCKSMAQLKWLADSTLGLGEVDSTAEKSWSVGAAATAARAAGWGPHPEVRAQTDADMFIAAAGLTNIQYLAEFESDIYLAAYVAEAFLIPRN